MTSVGVLRLYKIENHMHLWLSQEKWKSLVLEAKAGSTPHSPLILALVPWPWHLLVPNSVLDFFLFLWFKKKSDQSQLRGSRWFIWLTSYSLSSREARAGARDRDMGGNSSLEERHSLGCFLWLVQLPFLYSPSPHARGSLYSAGWSFQISQQSRKWHAHRRTHKPIW